jgi:hypothetical protein
VSIRQLGDRDLAEVDRLAMEAVRAIDAAIDRGGVVVALRRSLKGPAFASISIACSTSIFGD